MDKNVKYGIELSDYDLDTADAMLQSRGIYMWVLCVIKLLKKAFKAYFTKQKPKQRHSPIVLSFLAKRGEFYDLFAKHKSFIDQIEPLNIEARYPSHKERLLKSLTDEKCIEIIKNTKELQQWIKAKL